MSGTSGKRIRTAVRVVRIANEIGADDPLPLAPRRALRDGFRPGMGTELESIAVQGSGELCL